MLRFKEIAKLIIVTVAIAGITVACADNKRGFRAANFDDKVLDKGTGGDDGNGDGTSGQGRSSGETDGAGANQITEQDEELRLKLLNEIAGLPIPDADNSPSNDGVDDSTSGEGQGLNSPEFQENPAAPSPEPKPLVDVLGTSNENLKAALSQDRVDETRSVIRGASLWIDTPLKRGDQIDQFIELRSYMNLNCQPASVFSSGKLTNNGEYVLLFSSLEASVNLPEVRVAARCDNADCSLIRVITLVDLEVDNQINVPFGVAEVFQANPNGQMLLVSSTLGNVKRPTFEKAQADGLSSDECQVTQEGEEDESVTDAPESDVTAGQESGATGEAGAASGETTDTDVEAAGSDSAGDVTSEADAQEQDGAAAGDDGESATPEAPVESETTDNSDQGQESVTDDESTATDPSVEEVTGENETESPVAPQSEQQQNEAVSPNQLNDSIETSTDSEAEEVQQDSATPESGENNTQDESSVLESARKWASETWSNIVN